MTETSNTSTFSGNEFRSGFLALRGKRRSMPADSKALEVTGQEWGSMNLLGALSRRRSARALSRVRSANATTKTDKSAMKWSSTAATHQRTIERLETELSSAAERISELEMKVASRDAVLRRRAAMIQDDAKRISGLADDVTDANKRAEDAGKVIEQLSTRIEELEYFTLKISEASKERVDALRSELKEKDAAVSLSEEEVRRVLFETRPRPVQRVLRTALCASTGVLVALASTR